MSGNHAKTVLVSIAYLEEIAQMCEQLAQQIPPRLKTMSDSSERQLPDDKIDLEMISSIEDKQKMADKIIEIAESIREGLPGSSQVSAMKFVPISGIREGLHDIQKFAVKYGKQKYQTRCKHSLNNCHQHG